ncbi:ephrin-A1-like [Lepisosteus oculatus]|uniref:ephrin-A1-like n=1 Tax=Lepisosteus oculatus TaxID=7918 RepID=UPI00371BFBD1
MDVLWLACLALGSWVASAERHSVYWNSSNTRFLWDEYAISVRLNDYLDIICPHYEHGAVPSHEAERYVLYMVEREDYAACAPASQEQVRWECTRPFAPHGPERFSEKFQRFTPFTLGKEFRQGESYYYVSKPVHHHGEACLKLRIDVTGPNGSQQPRVVEGGAHNPVSRLPADDPVVRMPDVQRSVGNTAMKMASLSILLTLLPGLCLFLL